MSGLPGDEGGDSQKMVMPLENCSTYFLAELNPLASTDLNCNNLLTKVHRSGRGQTRQRRTCEFRPSYNVSAARSP